MLSDAFLSRLDSLSLAMRGRAAGGAGGVRRSRRLGSSAEFSDYREYIPGDDIRRLDWNALARFDKLFLKLFMEEQESMVTVLVDASASMAEKWPAARDAALAVSYLALSGGDRLHLVLLKEKGQGNQEGNRESPVLSGRQAFARVNAFLESGNPDGSEGLAAAVRKVRGLKKGLCFLITDGYTEDALAGVLDDLRYRRQECGVIQVMSPFEADPALDGALRLTDSETGKTLDVLADRSLLEQYRRTLDAFLAEIRENCRRRETPYLLLDGREPLEQALIPLLSRSGMI